MVAVRVLFNSWAFLFGFLPLALAAFFLLGRHRAGRWALPVLVVASLAFYAWWDWRNLGLLVPSLLVNFVLGRWLTATHTDEHRAARRRPLLVLGLAFNLGLLGWFKYLDFAIGTANALGGFGLPLQHLVLPLGISFFTFEQIAYIVDAYRGQARRYGFAEYCTFVTFYPHLIAGPIIQHHELLDQVQKPDELCRPRADALALGVTLFVFGLFKKVVIADACAPYVGPVYDDGAQGLSAAQAWLGTLAYSLQLYFDFSGYSDMAIGLARMVNIKLPANFNSPYQAHNPIEFWRRWHMTLSRFLRDYLYIPLGGNRGGELRRYFNNFLTMVLGGLWHGAGWGFVLWGALNGLYLAANHLWRRWRGAPKDNAPEGPWWLIELSCLGTFFLIMISRVFFRAPDFSTSWEVLQSLFLVHGVGVTHARDALTVFAVFAALYVFCRHAPNSQQVLASLDPVLKPVARPSRLQLTLRPGLAVVTGAMALASLLQLTRLSEFLYFQF